MNLYERNQKVRNFFNEKIDTYDDVHSEYMKTKNSLGDNLDKETKKVLDLGAGTGLELIPLFERFKDIDVTAIDITKPMLEELIQHGIYRNKSYAFSANQIMKDWYLMKVRQVLHAN